VRQHAHLFVDDNPHPPSDDRLLREEEVSLVGAALAGLDPGERELLLAHEVEGMRTADLAARRGSSAGAIAAQLNRTRAKLRIEYLLADQGAGVPTDRCRPVLYALSSGDRRRQRELDTAGHLLSCDICLDLSIVLFDRRPPADTAGEVRVRVSDDADVVTARQQARAIAALVGFGATELTVIATAVSEIARNIVKFAHRGEIVVRAVDEPPAYGVRVVARDVGPGIKNLDEAMQDGFSTYRGLGLGLAGARRLMDQFEIVSEVGVGTTVTMAKWRHPSAGTDDEGAKR
jgi:anti-sigma regulatory factor (Ser/Thr protein kinase)